MANLQYSAFAEMSTTADEYSDGLKASLAYMREQHAAARTSIREKNAKRARLKDVLRYVTSIVPELTTEIDEVCDAIVMTPEPRTPSDEEFVDALKAAYSSPEMLAPPPPRDSRQSEPEFVDVGRMAEIIADFEADVSFQRPLPKERDLDPTGETRKELEEYTVRYMASTMSH
jgi:hypothetical protein